MRMWVTLSALLLAIGRAAGGAYYLLRAGVVGFWRRREVTRLHDMPALDIAGDGKPYPELIQLLDSFHSAQLRCEVLFLGDSVVERVSRNDQDFATLGHMVVAELAPSIRVHVLSHSGYHPTIYCQLCRVFSRTRFRPEAVILPVNMRCFSPQWDLDPVWQFERGIQVIEEFLNSPEAPIGNVQDPVAPSAARIQQFLDTGVSYPSTEFERIRDFRRVIAKRAFTETARLLRQKHIFVYHYMHALASEHRKLKSLRDTLRVLREMEVKALVYITPVNYQAGVRLLGEGFRRRLQNNVDLVSNDVLGCTTAARVAADIVNHNGVWFQDCSTLLDSGCFFHEYDAAEHLNEHGRKSLAVTIARLARRAWGLG